MTKHQAIDYKREFVSDVRYARTEGREPIYYFTCPSCGERVEISGGDSGEPAECPGCGITYDINITAEGMQPPE